MKKFSELRIFNINNKTYKLDKSYKFKFGKSKIWDKNFNNQIEIMINNFLNTIVSNIPKEDLSFLFSNLNTLFVKKYEPNSPLFDKNSAQYYDLVSNTIVVGKYELGYVYHELFHMASAYYSKKNGTYHTGFMQQKLLVKGIGRGLNEGYTQLLTDRYFPLESIASYPVEASFAKILEMIIGREKMQSLYFNANLFGLVKELEKYCDNKEIIQMIKTIDLLGEEHDNELSIVIMYRDVYLILMKCFAHKFSLENPRATDGIIYENFINFCSNVGDSLTFKSGNSYPIITNSEQIKFFNDYYMEYQNKNLNTK